MPSVDTIFTSFMSSVDWFFVLKTWSKGKTKLYYQSIVQYSIKYSACAAVINVRLRFFFICSCVSLIAG